MKERDKGLIWNSLLAARSSLETAMGLLEQYVDLDNEATVEYGPDNESTATTCYHPADRQKQVSGSGRKPGDAIEIMCLDCAMIYERATNG